jgi:hypothetical protein
VDFTTLSQIAVAGLGTISAVAPLAANRTAKRDLRKNLQSDVSLLAKLPSESARRDALVNHIDNAIDRLIADQDRRRDPLGIGLALSFIVVSIAGGVWAINEGGWWLLTLIPVLIIFVLGSAGLAQDASRLKRDEKGRPLPSGQ